MAINFPNSPTNGQTTTVGNVVYAYNSTTGAWEIVSSGGIGTMTTKGDLLSRSITGLARVGVGTDGQVLTADSTQTSGMSWSYGPGLTLVKTQTVGTSVSSVTVTGAFSSAYENYRIIYSGGVGDSNAYGINLYLGSTRTGYYSSFYYIPFSGGASLTQNNNISEFSACGIMTTNGAYVDVDLIGPYLSRFTYCKNTYIYGAVGGGGGSAHVGQYLNNTSSYTDFTIYVGASALTGGTIRVYGYRNS